METATLKVTRATAPDLVVALFTDSQSAHGAIADLAKAGFREDRVAVAFSPEGKKAEETSHKGHWGKIVPPASEYSLAWRLRRWIEVDVHRRGAEQMTTEEGSSFAVEEGSHYSEVDINDTLRSLGIPEERVLLVDQILGVDAVLVLVDAAERSREVEVILETNCGQVRTATVIGQVAA